MATAKKTSKTVPAKKAAVKVAKSAAKPAAKAAKAAKPAAAPAAAKPIKTAFNKTGLIAHLAQAASVDPKAAKAVMAALEATMLLSLNKKGLGEFTLPGLFKVSAVAVPAKKKRFGKDPFSGEERWFAPKPASVKVKVRALKKIKEAAL